MSLEEKCNQPIDVLLLNSSKGVKTGALVRAYSKARTVYAHVEPLPATEIARLRVNGSDVSHMLWFYADPIYTSEDRLSWRGTIMRPDGPAVDMNGLGKVWKGTAKAMTPDNEGIALH